MVLMKYWVSLTEVSNYCKVQGKLVFDPLSPSSGRFDVQ